MTKEILLRTSSLQQNFDHFAHREKGTCTINPTN